jgi:hypothetical protein
MNLTEHLLERDEERESAAAQACEKSAKLYERVAEILGKSDMEEGSELASAFKEIAEAQRKGAAFHLAQGAYSTRIKQDLAAMGHRQPYNEFQIITNKAAAAGEGELEKLIPSTVQVVIGPPPEPELRAIPRAGQPPMNTNQVDPRFRKFVETEDEERPA